MRRLTLYATGLGLAFYALFFDMCTHLDGWRVIEPMVLFVLIIAMTALGRVIFAETDGAE